MFKKIILAAVMMVTVNLFAHEGHDQVPGALKANHGGVVKAGHQINLEYVVSANTVKIFPVSHDGIDLLQNEVKISATVKAPKGKAEPAKLEFKDGSYVTTVDFKGAYRIEMVVTAEIKAKKDSFKFQIEK